jgi:L-ascorbate metabolism protein UlaG (beta-lactamase superfamily)
MKVKRNARMRNGNTAVGLAFLTLVLLALFVAPTVAQTVEHIPGAPNVPHWKGDTFFNPGSEPHGNFFAFLRWVSSRGNREPWYWSPSEPGPPPPPKVGGDTLLVTFVNHSTCLLQTNGINILTDPIWSQRCSPVQWTGPKRYRDPGIRFKDLPRIDVVLISHNHFDHMDEATLQRIVQRDSPAILAGLGTDEILKKMGIADGVELDWWDRVTIKGTRFDFVPAQHFSSRGMWDRNRALWGGFVIETGSGPVYFAGDTGFAPFFEDIHQMFGPMRFSMLPIGSFLPKWFMGLVHLSPADAVKAHEILESQRSLGIHFGTFPLADDSQVEPIDSLRAALNRESIPDTVFRVLLEGTSWRLLPEVEKE